MAVIESNVPYICPGRVWTIAGATATGKSSVAQFIAELSGGAILSADSMLVYRGMDIGTAKPSLEQRTHVPYLGIEGTVPSGRFSTGSWLAQVEDELPRWRDTHPIIVAGGSGLYLSALLRGLDHQEADPIRRRHWEDFLAKNGIEALWEIIDTTGANDFLAVGDRDNPRRCIRAVELAEQRRHGESSSNTHSWPKQRPRLVALRRPREELHQRILQRIERMIADGLVEEAVNLQREGKLSRTASQAIGYAEALALAEGSMGYEQAVSRIAARTRQLAKRQMTWLRNQFTVEWVHVSGDMSLESIAEAVLNVWRRDGPISIATRRSQEELYQ